MYAEYPICVPVPNCDGDFYAEHFFHCSLPRLTYATTSFFFRQQIVYMMRAFGYCISYSFTSAVISDTLVIQIIAISDCSGEADGHHGQAEAGQSAQNGAADLTEK